MKSIISANKKNITNKLSGILCDEYILLTKTKNAYRNLLSSDFQDEYQFFKAQSNEIDLIIAHVEKRVSDLGSYADAMLKALLKVTRFNKKKNKIKDSTSCLQELLNDHETLIAKLKSNTPLLANVSQENQSDDFITILTESHQKMVWFLRSYLK
ncbi:ferritin-like domain-containing protein [Flavobacterium sp.]|uniref:Dps family protein n=1 Tax=Flavobacterium sp. TaxID=239 RepID=UPI003267EB6F